MRYPLRHRWQEVDLGEGRSDLFGEFRAKWLGKCTRCGTGPSLLKEECHTWDVLRRLRLRIIERIKDRIDHVSFEDWLKRQILHAFAVPPEILTHQHQTWNRANNEMELGRDF